MDQETRALLTQLLVAAELPTRIATRQLTTRGFDNEIFVVTIDGEERAIFRLRPEGTVVDAARLAFLASCGVAMPRLLAMQGRGELHEFIPGKVLGDAIEAGEMTKTKWRSVGAAFRQVHDVHFPGHLLGEIEPNRLVLRPIDPVAQLHAQIEEISPRLAIFAPEVGVAFQRLHPIVEALADRLLALPTSLVHGDVNMWNVMVDGGRAVLIDWDYPGVGAGLREVALLDKHASLFNGTGLPPAFFDGYGQPDSAIVGFYRVLETTQWALSDDWKEFNDLRPELRERTLRWFTTLRGYVAALPEHVGRVEERLRRE